VRPADSADGLTRPFRARVTRSLRAKRCPVARLRYAPMDATITDVARAAGVSRATAARALGEYGYVGSATRERVQKAASELGYVPNRLARALASGVSSAVGVVLGDVGDPFFGTIVRAMSDVLEQRGYTLLLANSDEDPERERVALETLAARRVDGLIVVPSSRAATPHLRSAAAGSAPLVLLDRAVRGLQVDSIIVDNVAGARTAVEYLLDYAHHRIAVIVDDLEFEPIRERVAGYHEALAARGIPADDRLTVIAGPTQQHAYDATRRLIEGPERPTAVFGTNTYMTLGAMLAVRDCGLRIPDDMSLLGFDDMQWTTLVDPPVSVVALPAAEMGRLTGERLLSRMDGDTSRPKRWHLTTMLIRRGSCGPAPT
jgi:LacI family transcriptional regulator, galactose operon repressor